MLDLKFYCERDKSLEWRFCQNVIINILPVVDDSQLHYGKFDCNQTLQEVRY